MQLRPVATLISGLLGSVLAATASADSLVHNARLITVDPAQPIAEAMLISDQGTIVAIGRSEDLLAKSPSAKRLDMAGRSIVPGLIDAHGHVLGQGLALMRADLVGTRSKAEVLQRLQAFAADLPDDAWLLGRGWDQNDWSDGNGEFPTAADLDAAFPERPVWLSRIDGHAGWANSAAMAKAERELSGDWQPAGGQIIRHQGNASGVFVDAAMQLVADHVPAESEEILLEALRRANKHLVSLGLTGVHDAGVPLAVLKLMQGMADRKELDFRLYAMADGNGEALDYLCHNGLYRHPGGRLSMRAVKLYADGALGSRGALLLAAYSDAPKQTGLAVSDAGELEQAMRKAAGCGVQVATHAIGDAANRRVLQLYQQTLNNSSADHRWRIEHAQIVSADDFERFHALGVIASMQPTHATSDMPWAEQRVGPERIVGGYAWRAMRDHGVRLALGSDFPVESADPVLGLYAAITRQDTLGQPLSGWYPAQRLTAFEALRGFTLDAAYAGFDEQRLGSLTVGKQADFVVLERDPLELSASGLKQSPVVATYLGGQPVFER